MFTMELGDESINIQDEKFINDLTREVDNLLGDIDYMKLSGGKVYKHATTILKVKKIEDMMSKRFGLTYKLLYGGMGVQAFLKISPSRNNGIDEVYPEVMDQLKKYQKGDPGTHEEDFRKDTSKLWNRVSREQDKYIKFAKKNIITVDKDKAYISGVPKDITTFIAIDWTGTNLLNTNSWSTREFIAILLHEIGHSFTFTEYSAKRVKNTVFLLENLKGVKDEKSYTKTLRIIGEEFGADVKNKTGGELVLSTAKAVIDAGNDNTHYYKDAEALADQFATRFGLGAEIVSVVAKIYKDQDDLSFLLNLYSYAQLVMVSLLFVFGTGSIAMGVGFLVGVIAYQTLVGIIIGTIFALIWDQKTSKFSYDSLLDRFRRVKDDIIRQVRILDEANITDERMVVMLERLENLKDNLIYAQKKRQMGEILGSSIMRGNKLNYILYEKTLERLDANPLIVMKQKLKAKLKGK